MYRHMSIEIGKNKDRDVPWSVNQSLEQFFTAEEREVRCEKCESGTTATQKIEIISRYVFIHSVSTFCPFIAF